MNRRSRAALGSTLSLALGSAALVGATSHAASAHPAAHATGHSPGHSAGHSTTQPRSRHTAKKATSIGYGGAVTTVDPEASAAALHVLKQGGNATDAAIAAAATLGVTEPYSSGIGGGGFFVHYDAQTGKVQTIDGRETAPASMPHDAFIDPSTGQPYNFTPELVTSGVSVGTPGSLATWQKALDRWGTMTLGQTFRPAIRVADRGFVVDATFREQTLENKERFAAFRSSRKLFLPGGDAPAVGSIFRNPALAQTYRGIAAHGITNFYRGKLGRQIAQTAQHPPKTATTTLPVPPGYLHLSDLKKYSTINHKPTHVGYRGYDVYGMAPSSSGGSTIGEALNIMERSDLSAMSQTEALHYYLDASALAFADRGAYVGDRKYDTVPLRALLSDKFAAERACLISPTTALAAPVPAGDPYDYDGSCGFTPARPASTAPDTENLNTTNMTVADRWGNIVEYTLTIEQTGGSGIVVPGRGFLLNNELTDFTAVYDPKDPNRIQGGKRPRSSISPTIVLKDGKPFLALGSPGGSTIITTVLQMLFNRIDRGMTIQQAIAAPRASQRNTTSVTAEQSFIDQYQAALAPYGYTFAPAGAPGTTAAEIGAATAIEFGPHKRLTAVSEPVRRGGGSALVVRPAD
jgi:gamma-glutamyltranspeptidase / glutathione hydrolase